MKKIPWAAFAAVLSGLLLGGVALAKGQEWESSESFRPAIERSGLPPGGESSIAGSVTALPDGGVVIIGAYRYVNGVEVEGIARLHPDGSIDTGFSPAADGNPIVRYVYPHGQLLVTRTLTPEQGPAQTRLERWESDGQLDASFLPVALTEATFPAVAVGPDGRIWIAGSATVAGQLAHGLGVVNADGSPAAGYVTPFRADSIIRQVAVAADGRVFVAGNTLRPQEGSSKRIARLLSDGTLDTTFQVEGDPDLPSWLLPVEGGGVIFAIGSQVQRLQASGASDPNFQPQPSTGAVRWEKASTGNFLYALLENAQGIESLVRFHPDGTPDASFSYTRPVEPLGGPLGELRTWSGETHYIAGPLTAEHRTQRHLVSQLSASGDWVAAFSPRFSQAAVLTALGRQPDGKHLVAGDFDYINGVAVPGFARLESEGALDTGFSPEVDADEQVHSLEMLPDGGFVARGNFGDQTILRFDAEGQRVQTYALNEEALVAFAADHEGRVYTTSMTGVARRYQADGALDPGFQPSLFGLQEVLPAADGGLWATVAAGPGQRRLDLVRLLPTGEVDPAFAQRSTGTMMADVLGLAVLRNGHLLVVSSVQASLTIDLLKFQCFDDTGAEVFVYTGLGEDPVLAVDMLFQLVQELDIDGAELTLKGGFGNHILDVRAEGEALLAYSLQRGPRSLDRLQWVASATKAPQVAVAPLDFTRDEGAFVTFTVTAYGLEPFSYQWFKNGLPIMGARGRTFTLMNLKPADSGEYSVLVSNAHGEVTSGAATFAVIAAPAAQLMNVSTLGYVGDGDVMIAGFVLHGETPREVLLRAVGPALAEEPFEVAAAVSATRLVLFRGQTPIAEAGAWEQQPNASEIAQTAERVGAFELLPGSQDAAYLTTLEPGVYSVHAAAQGEDRGLALVEVYDGGPPSTGTETRLVNISTLGQVSGTSETLNVGFVVVGNKAKTMLIRAAGPTLEEFDVDGFLTKPQVALVRIDDEQVLADNAGWGSSAAISQAAEQVQAFPLLPDSEDAAILITLQPGLYSAVVTGREGTAGAVLAEVYEVEN